jgi:hypothetical protein
MELARALSFLVWEVQCPPKALPGPDTWASALPNTVSIPGQLKLSSLIFPEVVPIRKLIAATSPMAWCGHQGKQL